MMAPIPLWFIWALLAKGDVPIAAVPPGQAVDKSSQRSLTLTDCVRTAVRHNLSLEIQRLEREQAALEVELERGVFWPVFFVDLGLEDERSPSSGEPSHLDTNTFHYDGGVEARTPIGTEVRAALTNSRRGTNNPSAANDPEHRARLELAASQPLLRGFGQEINAADQDRARLGHRQAVEAFRSRLNAVVHDVEGAYWDLSFAQQDVTIKARSIKRARKQFEDTQENIRRGLLPRNDIYVVEESLVQFERQHRRSLNALAAAQARLAELMQLDPDELEHLVAEETPDPQRIVLADEEDLVAVGLIRNPDLQIERARAQAAGISLKVERNSRLPRLDVQASLALNGVTPALGSSWEQLTSFGNREAFVGLSLSLPLFDLLDDSRVVRSELELRRTLLGIREREQQLAFEIGIERRDILHLMESYQLACRVSELARLKLEAQQEKYRAGVAALKDLVQFSRELDEAEIEQARTRVALAKRVSDLHLAKGEIHSRFGIEVP